MNNYQELEAFLAPIFKACEKSPAKSIYIRMSQYDPIWIRLKSLSKKDAEEKGVTICAFPVLHARIVEAVKKRKKQDLAFRLALGNNHARLENITQGDRITFKMRIFPPRRILAENL